MPSIRNLIEQEPGIPSAEEITNRLVLNSERALQSTIPVSSMTFTGPPVFTSTFSSVQFHLICDDCPNIPVMRLIGSAQCKTGTCPAGELEIPVTGKIWRKCLVCKDNEYIKDNACVSCDAGSSGCEKCKMDGTAFVCEKCHMSRDLVSAGRGSSSMICSAPKQVCNTATEYRMNDTCVSDCKASGEPYTSNPSRVCVPCG